MTASAEGALAAPTNPWPLRAWVLGAVGAVGGLAIHALTDGASGSGWSNALRQAAATFIFVGAAIFGQCWQRERTIPAVLTATAGALVVALVFLWNGGATSDWSGGNAWRMLAAGIAVFILVPLVQASLDSGSARPTLAGLRHWTRHALPYDRVHDHAWTNALTLLLSFLFAGLFLLILI